MIVISALTFGLAVFGGYQLMTFLFGDPAPLAETSEPFTRSSVEADPDAERKHSDTRDTSRRELSVILPDSKTISTPEGDAPRDADSSEPEADTDEQETASAEGGELQVPVDGSPVEPIDSSNRRDVVLTAGRTSPRGSDSDSSSGEEPPGDDNGGGIDPDLPDGDEVAEVQVGLDLGVEFGTNTLLDGNASASGEESGANVAFSFGGPEDDPGLSTGLAVSADTGDSETQEDSGSNVAVSVGSEAASGEVAQTSAEATLSVDAATETSTTVSSGEGQAAASSSSGQSTPPAQSSPGLYSNALAGSVSGLIGGLERPTGADRVQYRARVEGAAEASLDDSVRERRRGTTGTTSLPVTVSPTGEGTFSFDNLTTSELSSGVSLPSPGIPGTGVSAEIDTGIGALDLGLGVNVSIQGP